MSFNPDYRRIEGAAHNKGNNFVPLYEHIISNEMMEKILHKPLGILDSRNFADKQEFFRNCCDFFRHAGYDTVSFERCIGAIMPGAGALSLHTPSAIRNRADYNAYPWDSIGELWWAAYADDFRALASVMPAGMKAIGGVGNGIFECVQELVSFEDLSYIRVDDPDLFAEIFARVGQVNLGIWRRFLSESADTFCVLRFGDDLGFKTATLISPDDIRAHVIPAYRPIIDLVHSYNKPFLLHSCGAIFDVMEDLIAAGINAKHSNEDQIAPFPVWVERYGARIGNFGGADMDFICQRNAAEIREYVLDIIRRSAKPGGFAFGTGNSIPEYVPVEGYVAMVNAVREARGEKERLE